MERTGISIHAPSKGATHCFLASTPFYSFQSTLPQRERLRGAGLRIYNLTFQSTLPRRERHQTVMAPFTSFPDFNPRSREGSDIAGCDALTERFISIHAPAKGATRPVFLPDNAVFHFNPRSREGSDPTGLRFPPADFDFNPRSREGSDLSCFYSIFVPSGFQSTLPRRERHNRSSSMLPFRDFNPRSREGSDIFRPAECRLIFYFNPRSREGSDRKFAVRLDSFSNFNPRSREGSDPLRRLSVKFKSISIHAPAKGATCSLLSAALGKLFQFTLPRRERPVLPLQPAAAAPISIHAPAKGATRSVPRRIGYIHDFNSRSREGSDHLSFVSVISGYAISIHAPAKGATMPPLKAPDQISISIHAPAKGAT